MSTVPVPNYGSVSLNSKFGISNPDLSFNYIDLVKKLSVVPVLNKNSNRLNLPFS